jgi:hypothetical protein
MNFAVEWNDEFYNARRFFKSKGNIQTISRHKRNWKIGFEKILEKAIKAGIAKGRQQFAREMQDKLSDTYAKLGRTADQMILEELGE